MVANPVLSALNAFLAIYHNLPLAVTRLINLSLGLFIVLVVVGIFYKIRS